MSRKNRLNLPPDLKAKFTAALGGKTPTTDRLHKLLDKEPVMPLDPTDLEAGRTPYTARDHAETVGADVGEALESVEAARQRRLAEGRAHVQDRMLEHQARGLDPNAPPENPSEAALADDGAGNAVAPPPVFGLTDEQNRDLTHTTAQAVGLDSEAVEIERLKAQGTARVREVADQMERRVLQRMPQIRSGGSKLRSLEDAAEILIAELQPGSQDAIRQVCAEHGLQAWVVILGAVDRMASLQELHAGEFDPEWINRAPGGTRPASVKEQKCEQCGGVLPSDARRGQKYCCSRHGSEQTIHSEDCGLKYLEMRQGQWVDTRGVRA